MQTCQAKPNIILCYLLYIGLEFSVSYICNQQSHQSQFRIFSKVLIHIKTEFKYMYA